MNTSKTDSIFKKQIQKNAPKDFESWILQNGSALSFAKDAAAENAASESFSEPTYGTKSKNLASDGLISSGYADYLKSRADSEDESKKESYEANIKIATDGLREGYSEYVKNYNAKQEQIQKSYIESIVEKGLFDIDEAYKSALLAGLSRERALYSATKAVSAAKNAAVKKAIKFANGHGYTSYGAKKYALSLGLDERYADLVAKSVSGLTKEERDRYASMSAEDYIASLK
jgi:hypothetical protein